MVTCKQVPGSIAADDGSHAEAQRHHHEQHQRAQQHQRPLQASSAAPPSRPSVTEQQLNRLPNGTLLEL